MADNKKGAIEVEFLGQEGKSPENLQNDVLSSIPETGGTAVDIIGDAGLDGPVVDDWFPAGDIQAPMVEQPSEDKALVAELFELDITGDIDEQMTGFDQSEELKRDAEAASNIVRSSVAPETKLSMLQTLGGKEYPPASIGEITMKHHFPEVPAQLRKKYSDAIDITLKGKEHEQLMQHIVDGENTGWETFINKFREEGLPTAEEMMGTAAVEFFKDPKNQTMDALKGGVDAFRTFDKHVTNAIRKAGADPVIKLATVGRFETFKEWWDWVDLVEFEGAEEVDVSLFFDKILDGDNPFEGQFADAMKSKYGDAWMQRMTAFLIKEGMMDAAAITFAASRKMFVAGDAFVDKVRRALQRAGVVGLGGGTTQNLMTKMAGDDSNLSADIGLRAGAQLGAEGLFGAAKLGARPLSNVFKRVFKESPDKAIRFDPGVENAIRSGINKYKTPVAATIARASIYNITRDLARTRNIIAEGIADGSDEAIEQVARITGMDPSRVRTWLPNAARIYADEFKDINPKNHERFLELQTTVPKNQKELEVLNLKASVIEKRVNKLVNAPPTKTEAGATKRATRVQELQGEARSLQDTIRGKAAALDDLTKELGSLEGKKLTTGNAIADRIIMGEAFGFTTKGLVTRKQTANQDTLLTYFNMDSYKHSPFSTEAKVSPGRQIADATFITRMFEPRAAFSEEGAATDILTAMNRTSGALDTFNRMIKQAMPSNKVGRRKVMAVLDEGSEFEKVYTPDELLDKGLTPREIDSYYAIRQTIDLAGMVMDNALVRQLSRVNPRTGLPSAMMWKETPVNVRPHTGDVPEGFQRKDFVRITNIRQSGNEPPIDTVVLRGELEQLNSVLRAHTGYLPRVYKDANYHVSVLNKNTGQIRRVSAFPRVGQAAEAAKNLEVSGNLAKHEVVLWSSWNQTGQTGRVAFGKSMLDFEQVLDQEGRQVLEAQLKEQFPGMEARNIKVVVDHLEGESMRRNFIGLRANEPIPGATVKESPEALAEYFAAVARQHGLGQWRNLAKEEFRGIHKNILDQSEPLGSPNMFRGDAPRAQRNLAEREWAWFERMLTNRTQHEKAVDARMTQWAMQVATKEGGLYKNLANVVDRMPSLQGFNRAARGTAAITKLLFWNMAQFMVQSSQTAFTVGANPIHAAGGVTDAILAEVAKLAGMQAKKAGKLIPVSKEAAHLRDTLSRSGYISDLTTTDIATFFTRPDNPVTKALATHDFAFKMGEGTNRMIAFFTARRKLMSDMKKGLLKGVDGTTFRGKIDDQEFTQLVVNRAKITALDMSKAGQLEVASGVGSILFQFKQVFPKALNIFVGKGLKGREKIGAAAAAVAMWGPTGIPMLPGLVFTGDEAVFAMTGKPSNRELLTQSARDMTGSVVDYVTSYDPGVLEEMGVDKEFLNRLAKKGIVNALSEGEIDLTHRIGLGLFVNDLIKFGSITDVVPAIDVALDMIDMVKKSGVASAAVGAGEAFLDLNINTYLEFLGQRELVRQGKGTWDEVISSYFGEGKLGTDQFGSDRGGQIQEFTRGVTGTQLPGDRTPEQTAVAFGREAGQVVSYIGHINNFISNSNRERFNEGIQPGQYNTFVNSQGKTLPVLVTEGRLRQSLLGITPGKVIEYFERETRARNYRTALDDWTKKIIEKGKNASRQQRRLMLNQMTEELQEVLPIIHELSPREFRNTNPAATYIRKVFNAWAWGEKTLEVR